MPVTDEGVLDRLLDLSTTLQKDLERFVVARELTVSRVHLLWVVGRSGPQTQRSIAHELEVTPRHVTSLVDDLEAKGLVSRRPHDRDRRAVLVTLTDAGREFVRELRAGRRDLASLLFHDTSAEELLVVDRLLASAQARLRVAVEAAADGEP